MFENKLFKRNSQNGEAALLAIDDALLAIHEQQDTDPLQLITALVAALRPIKNADADEAVQRWQHLNQLLLAQPQLRTSLRNTVVRLLASRHQVSG